MDIYLDIETIPSQRNDVRDRLWSEVTAPAQYKKPESIEKWLAENRDAAADEQWRRTALDGGYGELAAIGWATEEHEAPAVLFRTDLHRDVEASLLHQWFEDVDKVLEAGHGRKPHFIGHNIPFDLRFLHHRAVVLGVRPPFELSHNAAPWHGRYTDTMTEWAGTRDRIKLTVLCDILGIECADEIDGAGVWDAFRNGEMDKVVEHCRADVERVRQVVKRLRFQK